MGLFIKIEQYRSQKGVCMSQRHKSKIGKILIGIVLLILCLGMGFVLGNRFPILMIGYQSETDSVNLSKLRVLEQYIDRYFLNDVDQQNVEDYTYKGLTVGLNDPYSTYYTKEEYTEMMESLEGSYCGIGVLCTQDTTTGEIVVLNAFKKGSAYEAGIRSGDRIVKVEGESIVDEDLQTIVSKIRGEEGTKVTLTIYQAETKQSKDFTVERRETENETVTYELFSDKIGYIEVSEFDDVTADQFKEAVDTLEEQGMEGLIIDLRNNGGGVLTSAQKMLDRLLPKCLLTYTEDKSGKRQEYWAEDNQKFDKPLVILINGQSASASELFSGAIKDYGVGTLVGTKSFGKGIVQSIFPLQDGSAIKLTVAKYYTPNGICIHGTGIEPDVTVELPDSLKNPLNITKKQDTQLKKAIEVLKEKMQK